jgi:hypothetical protein
LMKCCIIQNLPFRYDDATDGAEGVDGHFQV